MAAALRLVDAARGSSMSLYSLQLTGSPENGPPLLGGGAAMSPSSLLLLLLLLIIAATIRVCRAQPTTGDRVRSFRGYKPRTRTPTCRHPPTNSALRENVGDARNGDGHANTLAVDDLVQCAMRLTGVLLALRWLEASTQFCRPGIQALATGRNSLSRPPNSPTSPPPPPRSTAAARNSPSICQLMSLQRCSERRAS